MDHPLQHLPSLAAIADTGSFTAAADALGVNRAAISKRIQMLEAALGVMVLSRSTRRVELTEAGRALVERFHQSEALLQQGVDEAKAGLMQPSGRVRVVCQNSSLAANWLGPALFEFAHSTPGISVDFSWRNEDPAAYQPDIELLMLDKPPPDRAARELCPVRWGYFASAGYLARFGEPVLIDQLDGHRFLPPTEYDKGTLFVHQVTGQEKLKPGGNPMTCNLQGMVFEMVRRGEVIGMLPNLLVGLRRDQDPLHPVLTEWRIHPPLPQTLYALYPAGRYQRAATKAVLAFLLKLGSEVKV